MPRYILKDADLQGICIAEAPSEHDAVMWGYRNPSKARGFSGLAEAEDAYFARTSDRLLESFKVRYLSEGQDEVTAQAMAEVAAGPRPVLPVFQVPKQAPMPRSTGRRRNGALEHVRGPFQASLSGGASRTVAG